MSTLINGPRQRERRRASRTAEVAAMFRAGAFAFPAEERPVSDPYARFFVRPQFRVMPAVPPLGRAAARLLERFMYTGMIGQTLIRCRYGDDRLRDAAGEGVDQAIMLGSGYDTTSLRLGDLRVRFFELDQPATLSRKQSVLRDHAASDALEGIEFIPCRFDRDSLHDKLVSHGFDRTRPVFVSWLAVTWYLSREATEKTLRELARALAPGSWLVLDYLHPETAAGTHPQPAARRSWRASKRRGEPWTFGIDPGEISQWLSALGFAVAENLTAAELTRRYFPAGTEFPGAEWISLVTARRKQQTVNA